jgi:transketolase
MRDIFVRTLLQIAEKDKNVILLTGDLGFGVLNDFWKKLPNQIVNVGIAEQNMIGFAAGLAKSGKIVYVYSIANFSSLRPFEQIRNDLAYHNLNVKIISIGAGFSYGSLGTTHHATEDISVMRVLPNVSIFCPADDLEASSVATESYKAKGVSYIRLGRNSDFKNVKNNEITNVNYPIQVFGGDDCLILTTGSILTEVVKAYYMLKKCNISASIYSVPKIKPFNETTLANIFTKFNFIVTVEEHSIFGGFGSSILELISKRNDFFNKRVLLIGLDNVFSSKVGNQDYLIKEYKIDHKSIYKKIRRFIFENMDN